MTREEAIKILKYNSNVIHRTINGETDPNEVEALDMAIKSLEKESTETTAEKEADNVRNSRLAIEATQKQSCEDCVSRQAVLEQIDQWAIGAREYLYTNATHYLTRRIQDIPPVTLQPNMGTMGSHTKR